jgi:hypothetical protein
MPKLIYDVRDGVTNDLATVIGSLLAQQEFVSQGMQLAVQCHEEIVFSTPGDVEDASNYPLLNDFFESSAVTGQFGFTICDLWQAGEADPVENEMVSSDIPTLILAGEYDPITPPSWGEDVAQGFSNNYYFEFPGIGHGASLSGECPLALTQSFITDPTTEPNAVCLTAMGGPNFAVPSDSAVVEVELESYTNDTFGISGERPMGWEELAPGTFARGASALDQTVIIQQASPPGLDTAGLLGLLTSQLSLAETPAQSGEYEDVNGRTWALYSSEFQGFPINLGFLENDEGLLIVILISEGNQAEAFYDAVFVPAMDALTRN